MTSLSADDLARDCVAVINLVGEVGVAARMYRLNVEVPRALLDAAADAGARYFGHASSISVYGSPRESVLDEQSETIDLDKPLERQIFESPTGVEYARTKLLAEQALRRPPSVARLDLYRIAKSADLDRLLESAGWGLRKQLLSLHEQSHCIYERDCADAIVSLMARGLSGAGAAVETIIVADPAAGTHAEALAQLRERPGAGASSTPIHLPPVVERLKNAIRYRSLAPRLPIGQVRLNTARLAATGFRSTVGYARALELAVNARSS